MRCLTSLRQAWDIRRGELSWLPAPFSWNCHAASDGECIVLSGVAPHETGPRTAVYVLA